jgi:hypothetical protein
MEACVCPKPSSLTDVLRATCKENLGQIQRFIFQREDAVDNVFATGKLGLITALASWTPLWIADDDTKVVSSPYVENFVIPKTEAATEGGGDNSTLDGVEMVIGANAATAIGQIAETPSSILASLRTLMCEPNLTVYMINQFGQIIGRDTLPNTPGTSVVGIPIQAFFVSDAGNDGLNTRDKADIRFGLPYGWRDNLAIVKPTAFNAKTQLWPPVA